MNDDNKQIKLINGQLIGIFLFIITLLISLLLVYNEKVKIQKKNSLFTEKQTIDISLINRIIVFLLAFYFVYLSYLKKNLNTSIETDYNSNLEILASILNFIASCILLYILLVNINNYKFDVSEIEEPAL